VGADGERATAAQRIERDPLCLDAKARLSMVKFGNGLADVKVARFVDDMAAAPRLDSESTLTRGWT
jgi:hypothetical protein